MKSSWLQDACSSYLFKPSVFSSQVWSKQGIWKVKTIFIIILGWQFPFWLSSFQQGTMEFSGGYKTCGNTTDCIWKQIRQCRSPLLVRDDRYLLCKLNNSNLSNHFWFSETWFSKILISNQKVLLNRFLLCDCISMNKYFLHFLSFSVQYRKYPESINVSPSRFYISFKIVKGPQDPLC